MFFPGGEVRLFPRDCGDGGDTWLKSRFVLLTWDAGNMITVPFANHRGGGGQGQGHFKNLPVSQTWSTKVLSIWC